MALTTFTGKFNHITKMFKYNKKILYFNYKKYIENHNVKRKTIIANMRKCLLNEAFLIEVLAYYCISL